MVRLSRLIVINNKTYSLDSSQPVCLTALNKFHNNKLKQTFFEFVQCLSELHVIDGKMAKNNGIALIAIVLVIFQALFTTSDAKVFQRCELAKLLVNKYKYNKTFLSNCK